MHDYVVTGRRTNEIGNVENWWTDASVAEFNRRAQCFVDQYGKYSLPDAGPVSFLLAS